MTETTNCEAHIAPRDQFLAWFDAQIPKVKDELCGSFRIISAATSESDYYRTFHRYLECVAGGELAGRLLFVRTSVDFWCSRKLLSAEYWKEWKDVLVTAEQIAVASQSARRIDFFAGEISEHDLLSRQWLKAGASWRQLRATALCDERLREVALA